MKQIEIICPLHKPTISIRWYSEEEIELLPYRELISWDQSDKRNSLLTMHSTLISNNEKWYKDKEVDKDD